MRVAAHTADPVKAAQVVLGVERARLYSLDRVRYTWATAREAAPNEKMGSDVKSLSKNSRRIELWQNRQCNSLTSELFLC